MKTSAVAICSLVCSVMLSACGGSSGKPDITFPASTSAATSAPAVTSESSTPPATQSSAHAPRGRDYVDPQGKYTMTLGNTWKATKGPAIAEYWVIGKPDHGIKPSLNITTEDLPAAAQGISPDVYMKVSIKNLKKAGFTVIKSGMIRGINTRNLGAIEYTTTSGKKTLHLLAILDLNDNEAVVATMGASPQSFVKYRAAVQPYMRTLKAGSKSA